MPDATSPDLQSSSARLPWFGVALHPKEARERLDKQEDVVRRRLLEIAKDLRIIATRVDQATTERFGANSEESWWDPNDAVRTALHEIHWGIANLGLDALVRDANRVDVARMLLAVATSGKEGFRPGDH